MEITRLVDAPLAGAFVVLAALTAVPSPLMAEGERSAEIGFAGYRGAETLVDFPALVKLPDCVEGFAYADALADGSDIYFTDAGGTVLPHEIDAWNASGKSFLWVKVPSLDRTTKITMHWGGGAAVERPAAASTWTGYVGVWHMNAADGSAGTAEPDATGHGLDATPSCKQPDGENNLARLKTLSHGKIGNACRNQGYADNAQAKYHQGLVVPPHWDFVSDQARFTVGGWFNAAWYHGYMRFFSAQKSNGETVGWEAYTLNNSNTQISANGSGIGYKTPVTIPSMKGGWLHVQFVFSGTTMKVYEGGTLRGAYSIGAAKRRTDGNGFVIGNIIGFNDASWNGLFDEVRIYDGELSADRIKAEYDTANDPVSFTRGRSPRSADLWCKGYAGTETLHDFPVYVKLPDCVKNFDHYDAAPDGSDVWFSDAEGNVLASECQMWNRFDTWNPKGISSFWVKVPALSRDTKITMHWGGEPPANRPPATDVWTGYVGVWHMEKANGASGTAEPDATGHGLDATPGHGANATRMGDIKPRDVSDQMLDGVCVQNQAVTGNNINGLQVPDYRPYIADATKMTVSGWFYFDRANGYSRLFSAQAVNQEGVGWEVWANNGVTGLGCSGSKVNVTAAVPNIQSRWMHCTVVYNGAQVAMYVDGRKMIDSTVTAIVPRTDGLGFTIGNNANFTEAGIFGCYDEVRMYDGVISADRALADFMTQNRAAEFLSETPPAEAGFSAEPPLYGYDCNWRGAAGANCTGLRQLGPFAGNGFGAEQMQMATIGNAVFIPSTGGGAITAWNGGGAYGAGFNFGSGNWTFHSRVRTANLANGVVWCLGNVVGANTGLLLLSNGADGVALVTATGGRPVAGSRLEVAVPGASAAYHDYAAVYNAGAKTVSLYVDGVLGGTLPHPNFNAANGGWQFFSPHGSAVETVVIGQGNRIDEFRFYQRAVTAEEMVELRKWNSFDESMRRVYRAQIDEDAEFDGIAWTPAKPAGGFRSSDLLEIDFTSPGKTIYMSTMPVVAGLTVRGCPGAEPGMAGTLVDLCVENSGIVWMRLEGSVTHRTVFNASAQNAPFMRLGDGAVLAGSECPFPLASAQYGGGIELLPGASASVRVEEEGGLIGWSYVPEWIDLNGGTLAKEGDGLCWIANARVLGEGTIDVRAGTLRAAKTLFSCAGAALNVAAGATFHSEVNADIRALAGEGSVTMSANAIVSVRERLSGRLAIPAGTDSSKVQLAAGAELDLSANRGPFVQTTSTKFLGAVNVRLPGDGNSHGHTRVIAWEAPPAEAGVTFAAVGNTRPVKFLVEPDGLYTKSRVMVIFVR